MNNKLVYAHYTLDTNELFYIGIGDEVRANNTTKRSEFWKRYYNKHGRRVEILYNNLTLEEAKLKEIELISKYGRINNGTGILVNLTDGGDGSEGYIHSLESKLKLSEYAKQRTGENNPFYGKKHSEEWKLNFSENHPKPMLGTKRPEHSEKMKGSNNANSTILLNLETGIFYYGYREAAESTDNLSMYHIRDSISGKVSKKYDFVKTNNNNLNI